MRMSLKLLGLLLVITMTFAACKQDNPVATREMISGTNSKVWKEVKETGSEGNKLKLSAGDKQARLQFFATGKFTATNELESMSGTWTYDPSTKNLALIFDDNPGVSENFTMDELTEKRMKIRAPGGVMTLERE